MSWSEWRPTLKAYLTRDRALHVKELRCVRHETWRGVAEEAWSAWGKDLGDETWDCIPSNQIVGMFLCELSAELLGEDQNAKPWN
jgi:hypothetical protein